MSELKDIIQTLAKTGQEYYAKICEVLDVDEDGKTADLRPLDGSADVLDAYIILDDENGGTFLHPEIGSLVCVVFITKQIAVVVNSSQLRQMQVKIEQVEFQIDKDGFLLRKETETLKALFVDALKLFKTAERKSSNGVTLGLIEPQILAVDNLIQRAENLLKDGN